jgi:Type I restriction enzyme HindI endonuclease subunit-like, C-terminal
MADGILDVFKSAPLDQPDLSILSDEFLAEVGQSKEKNLAVETLRRLLADEIRARSRSNIVEATKLSERLDATLRRYHNRAVDSAQVIEELIALAKDISAANAGSVELDLNAEELAFYDALAENGSAKALMAHEQLRILAQVLVQTIRGSATIDWTRKESVRAKMRIEVRKLLAPLWLSSRSSEGRSRLGRASSRSIGLWLGLKRLGLPRPSRSSDPEQARVRADDLDQPLREQVGVKAARHPYTSSRHIVAMGNSA